MGSGGWAPDPRARLPARDTQARRLSLPMSEGASADGKVWCSTSAFPASHVIFPTVQRIVLSSYRGPGTSTKHITTPVTANVA
jgi:hypothetical protein